MAESSLPWTDGTGDGGPYAANTWDDFYRYLFTTDQHASEGVLKGVDNELEVTGTASPVSVDTGAAIVNGKFYKNTAAVSVNVPTPTTATRIDRIVLRADYAAQTVRIARLEGTEGGGAPTLTQTDGTTWEISLAQVSITTGGVITVTDERTFCHFATKVRQEMIDDGAVGADQIAAAVAGSGLVGGAGSALSVNVDDNTIEINSDALRVKDGGITNTKLSQNTRWLKGDLKPSYVTLGGSDGHRPVDPDTGQACEEWHLCNGEIVNGVATPDMRNVFPVGAGDTYAKGDTGGATSHSHTVNISSDLGGSHSHTVSGNTSDDAPGGSLHAEGSYASAISPHYHNIDLTTSTAAHHQHGVNGDTGSSSSLPPYRAIYWFCYVGT